MGRDLAKPFSPLVNTSLWALNAMFGYFLTFEEGNKRAVFPNAYQFVNLPQYRGK